MIPPTNPLRAAIKQNGPMGKFLKALLELETIEARNIEWHWRTLPNPQDCQELAQRLIEAGHLTSYQALKLLDGKGYLLHCGPYVLMERIGQGGMGAVYRGMHRTMRRMVAIKFLLTHNQQSKEVVTRFLREVRTLAQLHHPNIVTAFDAAAANKHYYLVTEFIEGQDLSKYINQNHPISVSEAVGYIRQVAEGLAYAHQKGVTHRDVKPGNLLRDLEGSIKILDLGLSRIVDPEEEDSIAEPLTRTGILLGTAAYMAPEQAYSPREADHRVDIYGLGCTLYFLLHRRAPFVADSSLAQLLAHREQPPPRLSQNRVDVPPHLDAVYNQMMAKSAADRFPSMQALLQALDKVPSSWQKPQLTIQPPSESGSAINSNLASISMQRLGFRIQPLTSALSRALGIHDAGCLAIYRLDESGPAAQAGLQVTDVILTIQSAEIHSEGELNDLLFSLSPNELVHIRARRFHSEGSELVEFKLKSR